ncbi:hypothetical protein L7F22_024927 [Adiantum nelumboides]|nr:hypothetical protein [Adiantum nelumboides]
MVEAEKLGPKYECAICLNEAGRDAVVTACGHLFCWACLRTWLTTGNVENRRIALTKDCPSCRSHHPLRPLVPLACKLQGAGVEKPDFSCARCRTLHAVQPVVLHNCGHVYCWSCLHLHLHQLSTSFPHPSKSTLSNGSRQSITSHARSDKTQDKSSNPFFSTPNPYSSLSTSNPINGDIGKPSSPKCCVPNCLHPDNIVAIPLFLALDATTDFVPNKSMSHHPHYNVTLPLRKESLLPCQQSSFHLPISTDLLITIGDTKVANARLRNGLARLNAQRCPIPWEEKK